MMLALTLLAVGTVACTELIQKAHAGFTDGENVLIATHLAQRRLEELRNVSYANLTAESKASITAPSGFSRFSREVQVDDSLSPTHLTQIVVTVYWTTTSPTVGGEANVRLQTYRSNTTH
jgi:hypothetical protein